MSEPKSIKRDLDLPKSMDYQALRKEGIKYLQQLSGKIWTDFNEHDPGVTLLEQICYALTDVAYRTNISIEKLLFFNNDYKDVSNSNALFSPEEILPCGPLTLTDYRILLIDQVREVNNVWFEPVEDEKIGIRGLYNVIVQVSTEKSDIEEFDDNYANLKKQIKEVFSANRNLCEDINEVIILLPIPISISAKIDIKSDAVGEEVLSELFYRLNNYFNPAVQFHTYEELLKKGRPLEKIFETPSFDHGFIVPAELYPKNDEFYVTKIAEITSSIPGIRNVQELVIKKNGIKVYGNSIKIEPDHFADLEINHIDGIEMTKGGLSYDYKKSISQHLFKVKLDKLKNANDMKFKWQFDKIVKPFPFNQISDFPSVQNTLPGIYGVGTYGLPKDANEERKSKAKQLKGYLLMFDQIMANHLIQLQKVKDLFSIEIDNHNTYYGQLPKDFPGLDEIIDPLNQDVQKTLAEFDEHLDRKNRILDHLLARFGERFSEDLNRKVKSLFGPEEDIEQRIIQLKSEFLQKYPQLSRQRAQTVDYLKNHNYGKIINVPTFVKRVNLLLNIKGNDHHQGSLVDHLSHIKIHDLGSTEVSKATTKIGSGEEISYHQTEEKKGKITFLIRERKTLEYLLLRGSERASYHVIPSSESDSRFLVLFSDKKNISLKLCEVDSVEDGQIVVRKLLSTFSELNSKSEGFHVVEHILLRKYGVDEFHFQILDKDDTVLLQSKNSHGYEKQKSIAEDTVIAGCYKNNYEEVAIRPDKYIITLKDKHNNIFALKGEFPSLVGATQKINSLIKYFKEVEKDINLFKRKIVLVSLRVGEREVSKEFYNSKISVIIPEWIPRFQNEEFKLLLNNSLRQSLPAHISVNFVWLGIDGIRNFEDIQNKWLDLRCKPDFEWKDLNGLSDKLINILTAPKNEEK